MNKTRGFSHLEPYVLKGVQMTDQELGHGAFACVHELEWMGLKCAGKKIYDLLLEHGSYILRRFEEECHLNSQAHHPNIVQFLGVHFQQGERVPILVMEYLPTNLTSCIDQYGILPKEISYSILHGVALGLCYLHSQTPPIIHRDLSTNNVLLTDNMTAKIGDLGMATVLTQDLYIANIRMTPSERMTQCDHMTECPGTPAYMPPEVMVANPKYDTSIDEFSYGILIIHVFSGLWPEPQVGPNRMEEGSLIPVTEAERREVFLRAIGNEHPLMDLILSLINNDPQVRPHASEIVKRLAAIVLQFPSSFANRLVMLRRIQHQEEEKRALEKEREAERQVLMEKRDAESHQNLEEIIEETDISEVETQEVMELAMPQTQTTMQRESNTSTLNIVSRFRTMLTHISEHLTPDNAKRLAYITGLPSPSENASHKQLDVLMELEKRGVFSHKNIDPLIDLLTVLHRADIINSCQVVEFKEWVENVYRYKSPFYCTSPNSGITYLSGPIPNQPEGMARHMSLTHEVERWHDTQPQIQRTYTTSLDLSPILKIVSPLLSQWKTLGVHLQVDGDKLDEIEADYRKVSDCMREMLREWLKKDTPHPTWEILVHEVEEINPNAAEKLRTYYSRRTTINF